MQLDAEKVETVGRELVNVVGDVLAKHYGDEMPGEHFAITMGVTVGALMMAFDMSKPGTTALIRDQFVQTLDNMIAGKFFDGEPT